VNFTTTAAKMRVVVEGLPKVIDRFVARLGSGINENTNLGLETWSTHD